MDALRENRVRQIFDSANFIRDLGMQLAVVEEGACEITLIPNARHQQQHGLIHAGVMATMADHAAGCAARSVVGLDQDVLTVEFKINFLRPAVADGLRCRARVLRAGRTLVIVESEILATKDGKQCLVSKAMVTLAVKADQEPKAAETR